MKLTVTLLGVGTSTGVPVVACPCPVCTSGEPRNRRLRCSAVLELGGASFLIDTPPDLRQQALAHGLMRVDGVLYTHPHADHIYGLDDLRPYCFRHGEAIPCFGSATTLAALRRAFAYIWDGPDEGGGKPRVTLHEVRGPFPLPGIGVPVVPVPLLHGSMPVFGYRLGPFAYLTDLSALPETSLPLLSGVSVLVLGALRYRPHPTHLSVPEAIAVARRVGALRTILIHLSHEVDYHRPELELPPGVELGYDGLRFELAL